MAGVALLTEKRAELCLSLLLNPIMILDARQDLGPIGSRSRRCNPFSASWAAIGKLLIAQRFFPHPT